MSDLPVNDHLAGILSDFEALKRSFDSEDVDDAPSFTSASPVPAPVSSPPCHFFPNHSKKREEQEGGHLPPSFSFHNNNTRGSAAHSHSSLSSSPVFRTRAFGGSLSFNRGTTNKPVIQNNGSSVTRAASFQGRFNPNICSSVFGPGSDNDSLHSSTSSLEYSGGGGFTLTTNMASYPGSLAQRQYQGSHLQHPQVQSNIQRFSPHESGFKAEVNQKQGMRPDFREPREVNHGSSSALDLQVPAEGEQTVGMQRGDGEGMKYVDANANWNGLRNVGSSGEGSTKKVQQRPQVPKPRAKETPRLNKFPLDLDSLVSSISTASPTKAEAGSMSPGSGGLQQRVHSPPSTASPSASLSSLDSSSDTPCHSLNSPLSPMSPCSPAPSQSSVSTAERSCSSGPFSPAEGSQLGVLSEVVHVVSSLHCSSTTSSPRAVGSLEEGSYEAGDSVDLILQRIASFSWSVSPDTRTPVAQATEHVRSIDGSSLESGTTSTTAWREEEKERGETSGRSQPDPFAPMEETGEKERCIIGGEQEGEGKNHRLENIQTSEAEKENCVEGHAELEENEKEKGMETGKDIELETEVKVELYPTHPDHQTSIIRGSDLSGYVGIETVLDQIRRKTMKAGFEFNIMVVGQSGLGKSTLVNTLFKSKVSRKSCTPNYEEKISKTVKLHSVSHVIEEKGVKMKLTVIDTPGFGDQINNENCWEPIVKYVNEQYEGYLREELNVNRKRRIPDSRVHCCIYFLPPTGHRLRSIDVEFMKRLGNIVSIVPVISKADTLTVEERQEFKEKIRQDLAANGICVYPQREYEEDPEERILNDRIRGSIPFAVVGTDKEHQVNGNKVLGRKTKWGIIEVENVAHCEFANLRDLLIRSHLQDLKDVTHNVHYETYRVRRLNESNMNFSELVLSTAPLENGTDKREAESQL